MRSSGVPLALAPWSSCDGQPAADEVQCPQSGDGDLLCQEADARVGLERERPGLAAAPATDHGTAKSCDSVKTPSTADAEAHDR